MDSRHFFDNSSALISRPKKKINSRADPGFFLAGAGGGGMNH